MDDVAEIARGLTTAQRGALLNGRCGVPPMNVEWSAECLCSCDWHPLADLGLVVARPHFPGGAVRTALGLRVKAYLENPHAN